MIDVRSERKAVGSMSIIRQRSATNLCFHRTSQQIQEDAADLSILWFVKHGRMAFSTQHRSRIARPGDLVITGSKSEFSIECRTDADHFYEMLRVTMPSPILRGFLTQDLSKGLVIARSRKNAVFPQLAIAENILTGVFEEAERLVDIAAQQLIECALTMIGHAARADVASASPRPSNADRRLADVLRFIEVHLSNQRLSVAMVASGCGISPRYLSFLLQLNGTRFSTLVWHQRLAMARSWLLTSDPRDISVSEIAYGVGFKSPAHFSSMFKRVYHRNPSELRSFDGQAPKILHIASGPKSSHDSGASI